MAIRSPRAFALLLAAPWLWSASAAAAPPGSATPATGPAESEAAPAVPPTAQPEPATQPEPTQPATQPEPTQAAPSQPAATQVPEPGEAEAPQPSPASEEPDSSPATASAEPKVPPAQAPPASGTTHWDPEAGQVEVAPTEPTAEWGEAQSTPADAEATAPEERSRRGPRRLDWGFDRPMIWPRVGLGASFNSFSNVIRIGLGATYFFRIGVGLGLDFDDTIIIYRGATKADFPGIDEETPTNIAELTPHVHWIVLPGRGFSPYLRAGVGPVFYDNGLGTLGQWSSAAGIMFRLAGRFFVDLGVGVSAQFPDADYREVWSYMDQDPLCGVSDQICSLTVSPRIGLSFGFGIPTKGRR